MEQSRKVALSVDQTFWTCDQDRNIVYGIRLYNREPFVNVDYPYQIVMNIYSKGPAFIADTTQIQGGVRLGGAISYGSEAWFGTLSEDGKTISWKGTIGGRPIVWEKVESVPKNTTTDQYSPSSIYNMAVNNTNFIEGRLDSVYPSTFNP